MELNILLFIAGIIAGYFICKIRFRVGNIEVDLSDPDTIRYKLIFTKLDPDDLKDEKYAMFKIENTRKNHGTL